MPMWLRKAMWLCGYVAKDGYDSMKALSFQRASGVWRCVTISMHVCVHARSLLPLGFA